MIYDFYENTENLVIHGEKLFLSYFQEQKKNYTLKYGKNNDALIFKEIKRFWGTVQDTENNNFHKDL